MQIFPKSPVRAVLSGIGLLVILAAARAGYVPRSGSARPSPGYVSRSVMDEVGILAPGEGPNVDRYLDQMRHESGVDVRLLFVRSVPGGDLERFALQRARLMGLGREDDRRGMLFVYDLQSQRLRIEVGPKLEGIFTDGFLGYLMREHARAFFASGDPSLGIRLTLFMLHHKLRQAALGDEYDPRVVSFITDSVRLAMGGGATARAALDSSGTSALVHESATADDSVRFGAQPTPAAAYERYLDWLRFGRHQTALGLFTPPSQAALGALPVSPAYIEYIFLQEYAQPYKVDVRGDLAMLYFTGTPLVSPHFFRHTSDGWQMDIIAEVRYTRNYAGGAYTWGMSPVDNEYARAFADDIVYQGPVLRLADGDNRPLPSRP